MDKEAQQRLLRKAYSDISRGYSVAFLKSKKLFIKHLTHHDQVDIDIIHKRFREEGIKAGLQTEQEVLAHLEKEGIWGKKDEQELEDIKKVIERLVAGKRIIFLKSDLERQNKFIKEEEEKYYKKRTQKDKLLGITAEAYAEKKANEHYIIESFYLDANLQNKYLTDEVFDNISQLQMEELVRFYNREIEAVGDQNIKRLAIQDFFQAYWSLSTENLYHFFGKPICDLTYFQIKLGSYGRTFKHILEKAESYPEEVRNDPDKLLDYVRTGENAKERLENAAVGSDKEAVGDGAVASTLFGAKKDELESVGIKSDPGTTSLTKELQKAQSQGKKGLNMQDMMKLMGA